MRRVALAVVFALMIPFAADAIAAAVPTGLARFMDAAAGLRAADKSSPLEITVAVRPSCSVVAPIWPATGDTASLVQLSCSRGTRLPSVAGFLTRVNAVDDVSKAKSADATGDPSVRHRITIEF